MDGMRVVAGDGSGDDLGGGRVVGVIGASGGVGSSGLAAALARAAGRSTLVDLDETGGGLDVLLGIEHEPGARWSDLAVDRGRIDPRALRRGLPEWGPCGVLAADGGPLAAAAVAGVVRAAGRTGPVVLDLPRADSPVRASGVAACDFLVLLVRADAVGVAAAHAVVGALSDAPVGVVVRRGPVAAADVAVALELPLLGSLAVASAGPPTVRVPRAVAALAAGIWTGLRGLPASAA